MQTDKVSESISQPPIVALLLINKVPLLPRMAIESILRNSLSSVVIGFVSTSDLTDLPNTSRIEFIDLSKDAEELGIVSKGGEYKSFDDDSFFSLVQLKWSLFKTILIKNPDRNLVYSDLDVFWVRDASQMADITFMELGKVNLLVQSFTTNPAEPNLCMGFAAFRNCPESIALVQECLILHRKLLESNPRAGDDDVISLYFREKGYPESIYQLPQSAFPVGNLLNLFSKRSLYPGLVPQKPYLYHSNFVVGINKKIETAMLFHSNQQIPLLGLSATVKFLRRVWIILRFTNFNLRRFLHLFSPTKVRKS